MKCPRCQLINPPDAMRCDCGYDFLSQAGGSSPASRSRLTTWGKRLSLIGIVGSIGARVLSQLLAGFVADLVAAALDLFTLLFFSGLTSWLVGYLRDRAARATRVRA